MKKVICRFFILIFMIHGVVNTHPHLSILLSISSIEDAHACADAIACVYESFDQELVECVCVMPQDTTIISAVNTFSNRVNARFVISQQGSYYARINEAARAAKAQFLTVMPLHDRYNSATIHAMLNMLSADESITLIYADYAIGNVEQKKYCAKNAHIINTCSLERLHENIDFGPHCIWRASIHEQYGYFDEHFFEHHADALLWLRLHAAGEYIQKIKGISGLHVISPEEQKGYAESAFLTETFATPIHEQKHFVIIVPSYNNMRWCHKNIDSLLNQDYEQFKIIYINDASNDGMDEAIREYISCHARADKFEYICNEVRQGALANIYHAVHACDPSSIIVLVDGDDWLAHTQVLRHLNSVYTNQDVWMSYGQFKRTDGLQYCSSQIDMQALFNKQLRQCVWTASHLRTFYAGLFQLIPKQDLLYDEATFYPMAWDLAIMYPMLEMAGSHSRFVPHLLYRYNTENPLNDHKVDYAMQYACDQIVRAKPPYEQLNSATW